jgi:hypothetical protein
MSLIGGIVEADADIVFGANSLGGVFDRFLLGRAPDGFKWSYRPCPIERKKYFEEWNMKPVRMDGSVFEVTKSWAKENPRLGRVSEICTRIAVIFASVDGRPVITGKDMEVLKPLATYELGLRQMFRPNAGENPDAIYANKALDWIGQNAANWVSLHPLKKALYRLEEKYGPNVANRALMGLARTGRIDLWLANGDRDFNPVPSDYSGPRVRTGLVRRVR